MKKRWRGLRKGAEIVVIVRVVARVAAACVGREQNCPQVMGVRT